MNPVVETQSESPAAPFIQAIANGDWERAEQIVESLGKSIPQDMLQPAAELHIHRRRWGDAARLINRVLEPTVITQQTKLYIQNMRAVQECRPQLYDALIADHGDSPYAIQYTQDGYPTIVYEHGDDQRLVMSANGHPLRGLEPILPSLETPIQEGQPIAILSMGDGYLLSHLAATSSKLFLTEQQALYLFEPDAQLVLASMHIHDMSTATGPIRQSRVAWYVGADCFDRFVADIRADRMMHVPLKVRITQVNHHTSIGADFQQALEQAF